MKRIYMVQPNSQYGDSVYFPYAAGSLIAYAFKDEDIKSDYNFVSFIYKKENLERVIEKIENPFIIGFSCYVWNIEYNKALVKEIKKKWPDCITVFGGHQIYEQSDIVDNTDVDILLFGEGEDIFRQVLLSFLQEGNLDSIPNLMYHKNGEKVFTEKKNMKIPERVSPYLNGWFDDILTEEKDLKLSAVLETNRGCPNRCSFCDWGNIKACVHNYSKEQVLEEIDWFADNKIEYCYCADGNFGLFSRDMEFIDYFIKVNKKTGFPIKFQATYSKNNPLTVFEINKRLNEAGMSKGATLSFQSMSEEVLNNINRQNMPLEKFKQLMMMYNSNGIPTYSELILGLPGETYLSFKDGIEQLLQYGQHMAINFFNCEILNNAEMNKPEYIKKYCIESVRMEQYQYHTQPYENTIKEFSQIVVSTNTMSKPDWIDSNVLGVFVRTFHNLGLLQCYAIYLHYENKIDYTDFYEDFIRFSLNNPDSLCGEIISWLRSKFQSVIDGDGSLTYQEDAFGEITWPLDESCFLMVLKSIDRFKNEIESFLGRYFDDTEVFEDLKKYQNSVVKTPASIKQTLAFKYDWYSYFSEIYSNSYKPLKRENVSLRFNPGIIYSELPEFAVHAIWYGRKGGQNIVSDIKYIEE